MSGRHGRYAVRRLPLAFRASTGLSWGVYTPEGALLVGYRTHAGALRAALRLARFHADYLRR